MPLILLSLTVIALVFGPQMWVTRTLRKYDSERSELPGTGGELAARFSAMALMVTPIIFLVTRLPQSTLITLLLGTSGMAGSLWVQLMNLPVELDASFNKALPILAEGYLGQDDLPGARKVLKAAAMTYVAAALASLLNIGRWISIMRR